MPLTAPTKKPIRIGAVRPNIGTEIAFRRRLDALIARMAASVEKRIATTWRRKPPEMLAQDESPAAALQDAMRQLASEWEARFDEFARNTGKKFAEDTTGQADRSFASHLRRAGFTARFKMTRAANDVMQATIAEQVGLIKSIPEQYLTQVQGIVMRGVQAGRDMHVIAQALEHQFGVTKRRAAFIARDQSNKATATITRVRQEEVGVYKAGWLHSAGGKTKRPTHVKASRDHVIYDVREGWLDPAVNRRIWPGTEPGCRCVSVSVIEGL